MPVNFGLNRQKKIKPGVIDIIIGKPIDPKGFSIRELTQEVETFINNELSKL